MTEVIVMESAAYQKMMGQIAKIAEFHISTRTLQRLRSDGLVEYSVFRRKCLYKLSEIEKKVREKVITCEPHLIDVYKKNRLLDVTKDTGNE